MKEKTNSNKIAGLGVLTAITASLCCITPILSLISGVTGIAASFSWIEPFRPYLIGITVLVLSFAWYQKLKPQKKDDIECSCENENKHSFWQSTKFLGIVSAFAILMTAFPYYSNIFYLKKNNNLTQISNHKFKIKTFKVTGMTCTSCEKHIQNQVSSLKGISVVTADFKNGTVDVRYDEKKISEKQITNSINKSGYKVIGKKVQEYK